MRWDRLFHDLESRTDVMRQAQFQAEVSDRTRAERAGVEFAARLLAASGRAVSLTLANGERVTGEIADAAAGWVLLGTTGPQTLVPVHAISAVSDLPTRAAEVSEVVRRLGMGHALRALARDRARVVVDFGVGQARGLIGAVGADFVEVSDSAGPVVAVPVAAILTVRSGA